MNVSSIASRPKIERTRFLDSLSEGALLALPHLWGFWAHPHQLAPAGNWRTWLVMGGRGAGKTRAGAEWVRSQVEGDLPTSPGLARRVALVGETLDQAREVMVFGESGLLACSPPDRRPEWLAGRRMLIWPNGAVAQLFSAFDPESLRGPQFDAAWLDEIGCAAVDKGANQPNRFLDPKSSESALPYYSNGRRDDVMQMQVLRAVHAYWAGAEANPVSAVYGGPMVDMGRCFVWAWDARPFPAFPNRSDLWSDGGNFARGHWLNGRGSARSLASVAAEVCDAAGVAERDVSRLYGLVRGYAPEGRGTGRGELQPLMLAYGFEAIEREGRLVFRSRGGAAGAELDPQAMVAGEGGDVELVRAPEAEVAGRLRLSFVDAEGDYEPRTAEAVFPDEAARTVSDNELPLALVPVEGRGIAERWLAEARIARDTARFALPLSRLGVGAGEVVRLGGETWRIDRVEFGTHQEIEAVRSERETYVPSDAVEAAVQSRPFVPPVPVFPLFLDLPLMRGSEVPHAPHIAVTARPWPGAAVYASASDDGYALDTVLTEPAVLGVLTAGCGAGRPGLVDRVSRVELRLTEGELASADMAAVLNGANLAAIGDGTPGGWELVQFAGAELVGPRHWVLTELLRGQLGTASAAWPEGSYFVLVDGALRQIGLQAAERRLARHYRVGPAQRGYDDPAYRHIVQAFDGIGLRPLSPVHLREAVSGAGRDYAWVRRTRIGGDSWEAEEVPLGEAYERYRVTVTQGGSVVRTAEVSAPGWSYGAAEIGADGLAGAAEIRVAQLSEVFGPGVQAVLPVAF